MSRQNNELDIDNREEVIFIINSPYPNYAGGIENWLYNISSRISDRCRITIVSIKNEDYPKLYDVNEDITILTVKTLSSYNFLKKIIRGYMSIIDIMIASFLMKRVVSKHFSSSNKFLYIICLDTMFCVRAGLSLKKKNKLCKVIASSRGPHAEIYSKNYPLFKSYFFNLEKKMLNDVDEIWGNGEDTIIDLKNKGYKASLMLNGVDYERFSVEDSTTEVEQIFNRLPSVINVATLLPIKGIKELLDAANYIINSLKVEVNFVFVGKGDADYYLKYAESKNISEYVFFLGHKTNPSKYIQSAKIATCLSGGSGLSMAAIECMASGTPTLAWDTPVYHQFNRQYDYFKLIEQNNHIELGIGIIEMINNYDHYIKVAHQAKEYAEKYDWNNVTEFFLSKLTPND